jgi:membrane protein implicated in regulation of membrane protease activity
VAAVGAIVTVMAHLGHWYVQLAFVAPVIAVVAWLAILGWRDRRDERREQGSDSS